MTSGPIGQLVLRINPNAVGLPAKVAASECATIFTVAHAALQTADLGNLPRIEGEYLNLGMDIVNRTEAESLQACDRRLAAMCISDLARAIRASMEAAAAYIEFRKVDMASLARPTDQEVMDAANAKLSELTAEAQALNYPPLLERVQAGLSSGLTWAPELVSFQKLRNCLEHRGGVVGLRDLDENAVLSLRLPFLEVGIINDQGKLDPIPFGIPLKKETSIGTTVSVRHETFALGQAIAFPPSRIREIAFSVWLFAEDLVAKLGIDVEQVKAP